MRFGTTITVDGLPVITNVPRGSSAWRKANAIFCPLGPAPMQAWMLMLRSDVNNLDVNAAHTINWSAVQSDDSDPPVETTTGLVFPGLYIVNAERVLHGGPDDGNALYLVEFADVRYLVGCNSATGPIRANLRSYANQEDYLTGSDLDSYRTWDNLVSAIWSACGLFGSYPGLPPGLPIDGVPENTYLIGLNALRALTAVLEQLDCALERDPFTNNFSIVQLGESQSFGGAGSLKFNTQPVTPNSNNAEQLNIHFFYHHKAYGQERDTELNNNAVVIGGSDISTVSTGIAGATGTAFLWDDLPIIIDETGNQTAESSAAQSERVASRLERYITRRTVLRQHAGYIGLVNDVTPGGQVRAVLWRNWDDGDDNDFGGTVTEFICGPDLVKGFQSGGDGPAWFDDQLAAPEREQYSPPDFGRHTVPNYPRLANIVQVWHSSGSVGDSVDPDITGPNGVKFHTGRLRRWVNNAMDTLDACWILFVDNYDTDKGNVKAVQGECYGPGRLSGITTVDDQSLPVYMVGMSAGDTVDPVTVHHDTKPDGSLVQHSQVTTGGWNVFDGRIAEIIDNAPLREKKCWIYFDDCLFDQTNEPLLVAEVARTYGPAKLHSIETIAGDTRPMYVCSIGGQEFNVKASSTTTKGTSIGFRLYDKNGTDSGIELVANAKYNAYDPAEKWAILKFLNGEWVVNKVEC